MKTKRFLKSLFVLFLTVCFALCLCGCEEEKLTPTPEFFVNDFSGVLDDSVKSEILSRGAALQEKTTAQAVAVTIESTDGEEMSDYALNLGREWGIGDKEQNNGILILLATEDRQIYISVGYGLEGALPDSKTGRILDNYAIPYLKNDEYSKGILETYKAVVNEIYLEYGIETDEGYIPVTELPETQSDDTPFSNVLISWAFMLLFVFVYLFIFRRRRITVFPFININNRHGGGGFGGFGGFGGGSSSGGFGGFSGGGGSFGGGGAGRGF